MIFESQVVPDLAEPSTNASLVFTLSDSLLQNRTVQNDQPGTVLRVVRNREQVVHDYHVGHFSW